MLQPISDAEQIIKRSMGAYQQKVDAERRAAEAEARRLAQEERDRLLAEAVAAEDSGDNLAAQTNLIMAEIVEDMKTPALIAQPLKAQGVSTRMVWKARLTDPAAVPCYANGVEIRPVDLGALNTVARLTKGTAIIPGVEFCQDAQISARA